jgi:hypothetical protein
MFFVSCGAHGCWIGDNEYLMGEKIKNASIDSLGCTPSPSGAQQINISPSKEYKLHTHQILFDHKFSPQA